VDTWVRTEELELDGTAQSVRLAREFVRQCVAVWRPDTPADKTDDAVLIASELTTNAARHEASRVVLRLVLADSRCRIEVSDDGRTTSSPPAAGKGPSLCLAVAAALGVLGQELNAQGSLLWVDLAW
jgi:signal transduction histidine kinase